MPTWGWIVLIVLLVLVGAAVVQVRLMRKHLLDHTSVSIPPEVAEHVRMLARSGQPVLAIKELRAATGLPLLNAKLIVDRMAGGAGD